MRVSHSNAGIAFKEPRWVGPAISVFGVTVGVVLTPFFQARMNVWGVFVLALVFMAWGVAWGASEINVAAEALRKSTSGNPQEQNKAVEELVSQRLRRVAASLLGAGGFGVLAHSLTIAYDSVDWAGVIVVALLVIAGGMIIYYVSTIGFDKGADRIYNIGIYCCVVVFMVLISCMVS